MVRGSESSSCVGVNRTLVAAESTDPSAREEALPGQSTFGPPGQLTKEHETVTGREQKADQLQCYDHVNNSLCGVSYQGFSNYTWELTLVPYLGSLVYHWSNITRALGATAGGRFAASMSEDFDTSSGILIGGATSVRTAAVWEIG